MVEGVQALQLALSLPEEDGREAPARVRCDLCGTVVYLESSEPARSVWSHVCHTDEWMASLDQIRTLCLVKGVKTRSETEARALAEMRLPLL